MKFDLDFDRLSFRAVKKSKTFRLDSEILSKFEAICKKELLSQSDVANGLIKGFVSEYELKISKESKEK
jgi:hypothetical protein